MKINLIALMLLLTSCAMYSPIRNLDYDRYNLVSSSNSGNFKYKDLGPIISQHSGLFVSCASLANLVIQELSEQTKERGGDATINVSWLRGDFYTPMPHCTTTWYYIIPIKSVEASGTAANIIGESKTLPNSQI